MKRCLLCPTLIQRGSYCADHQQYRNDWSTVTVPAVYARDGRRCQVCGNTDGPFDIDHIDGRSNEMSNLRVRCRGANRGRTTCK